MQRTIEVETSQFDPNAYWVYGGEYFAKRVTVEYPKELDYLSDDELDELADSDDKRVFYRDS